MKYYNDKKYYVKRALKIAKKNNFQEGIRDLSLLQRHQNVFPIDFVKKVNKMDIMTVDLFNIELNKMKDNNLEPKGE